MLATADLRGSKDSDRATASHVVVGGGLAGGSPRSRSPTLAVARGVVLVERGRAARRQPHLVASSRPTSTPTCRALLAPLVTRTWPSQTRAVPAPRARARGRLLDASRPRRFGGVVRRRGSRAPARGAARAAASTPRRYARRGLDDGVQVARRTSSSTRAAPRPDRRRARARGFQKFVGLELDARRRTVPGRSPLLMDATRASARRLSASSTCCRSRRAGVLVEDTTTATSPLLDVDALVERRRAFATPSARRARAGVARDAARSACCRCRAARRPRPRRRGLWPSATAAASSIPVDGLLAPDRRAPSRAAVARARTRRPRRRGARGGSPPSCGPQPRFAPAAQPPAVRRMVRPAARWRRSIASTVCPSPTIASLLRLAQHRPATRRACCSGRPPRGALLARPRRRAGGWPRDDAGAAHSRAATRDARRRWSIDASSPGAPSRRSPTRRTGRAARRARAAGVRVGRRRGRSRARHPRAARPAAPRPPVRAPPCCLAGGDRRRPPAAAAAAHHRDPPRRLASIVGDIEDGSSERRGGDALHVTPRAAARAQHRQLALLRRVRPRRPPPAAGRGEVRALSRGVGHPPALSSGSSARSGAQRRRALPSAPMLCRRRRDDHPCSRTGAFDQELAARPGALGAGERPWGASRRWRGFDHRLWRSACRCSTTSANWTAPRPRSANRRRSRTCATAQADLALGAGSPRTPSLP